MSRIENIKEFFKDHQDKIILTIGFILVCAISFAAGRLSIVSKSEPIEIDESNIFENKDTEAKVDSKEEVKTEDTKVSSDENDNKENVSKEINNEGVFVGNIENNKFYPFNSKEVGNIASDNMMWFDSQEEAEEQGYTLVTTNSTTSSEKSISGSEESTESDSAENCKYVGSKNSDKYHLPDSGTAKNIKEENKVCFSSKEEAESKGYTAGASIKD